MPLSIFKESDSSPGGDASELLDGGLVDVVSLGKGKSDNLCFNTI